MAESTGSLHRITTEELLLAGPLKKGQWPNWSRPLKTLIHPNRWTLGPLSAVILGPLRRVPRAFLATGMLARDANLIGAEKDIASMACTADADAHNPFHSLCVSAGRGCPFPWLELESVLDEHGTSLLFLDFIAGRSRLSKSLVAFLKNRLCVHDRLLQSSRNRGSGRSPGLRNCFRGRGQGRAAKLSAANYHYAGILHTCSPPSGSPPAAGSPLLGLEDGTTKMLLRTQQEEPLCSLVSTPCLPSS